LLTPTTSTPSTPQTSTLTSIELFQDIFELPDKNIYLISNEQIIFPITLTSTHRKIIHSLAIELDLFHCSVGEGNSRQIIISKVLPIILPQQYQNKKIDDKNDVKLLPKLNIIHQYFQLSDEEKKLRENLVCIDLKGDDLKRRLQQLHMLILNL